MTNRVAAAMPAASNQVSVGLASANEDAWDWRSEGAWLRAPCGDGGGDVWVTWYGDGSGESTNQSGDPQRGHSDPQNDPEIPMRGPKIPPIGPKIPTEIPENRTDVNRNPTELNRDPHAHGTQIFGQWGSWGPTASPALPAPHARGAQVFG